MKPISTRAYRKLRFTNRTPTVGDRVFLHKAPTGIVGTVVAVHDDPYVPVVDIELSSGQAIEMVPRSNVRVVNEAAKRETMRITKRQLRQIIRESIEVMNSDTGELLLLPDSYVGRYNDGQEVDDGTFRALYNKEAKGVSRYDDDDELFDPEEALDELRATAQVVGNDWSIDNPGQSIEDVAYDLAAGIEWQVSQATWDSALEMFDGDNEELIWALAEAMT